MEIREISVIRIPKLYGIKCIRHKLSRCLRFLIDGWKSAKSASSAFLNYKESNIYATDDSDLHQIFKRWMEIREISEIRVIRIPKIMQNQIYATDCIDYPRF
ncbi:hypothetical protein CLV50_1985 [Flavobacterium lindanitolerans]|uniref:Uncharacterized protein n=1 Tax=Flavobacterium lindanitolerans TaxID=428988 RepID=A0A497UJ41_9FLAO|nr:hypothetical protein B0G92_2065 [Flavobacterium lindanitolerans]RLJ30572.1 hypothetical protein CLV50_1985 [Flavobacterium lindanitolerans]